MGTVGNSGESGNLSAFPPYRPDGWHWQFMSDQARDAYLCEVFDWLYAQGASQQWLWQLVDMAEWYQTYATERIVDPNWKRGGTSVA